MPRKNGFTLTEIIIAIALLGFVFLFFNTMTQTISFTNKARFDDIGLSIAIEEMETYKSTDFNALPESLVTITNSDLSLLPNGAGTVTVTDYGSADSGIKQIDVVVTWVDHGSARDVALNTLVTTGGIGK